MRLHAPSFFSMDSLVSLCICVPCIYSLFHIEHNTRLLYSTNISFSLPLFSMVSPVPKQVTESRHVNIEHTLYYHFVVIVFELR